MLRQSPSRIQRSKGIKAKYVLQICLLLAVCFWLIFQVKHSHDKKKEFDEEGAKISLRLQSGDEILKFGRKDLHPRLEETTIKNDKHDEEEAEEEEIGGGEENKHEEEVQEEDIKAEEREDEERGGGDDEIDEHDQEKPDMEIDHEEDFIDEEKEREEGDEKEGGEIDAEDKEDHIENGSSLDHDTDGDGSNTHEAREEHYKADDASSAVTHDTQSSSTKNEESTIPEQEIEVTKTKEIDIGQNSTGLKMGVREMTENGTPLNATASKEKGLEIVSSRSEYSFPVNSTMTAESSNNQPEVSNNSTEVSTESHGLSLQNRTETTSDSTQAQNAKIGYTTSVEGSYTQIASKEQANNSNTTFDGKHSDSNSMLFTNTENPGASMGESSNSSTTSETVLRSNASAETEDGSASSITDVGQNEKLDTSNKMDGTNARSDIENEDEVQHDPIDSSDSSVIARDKEIEIRTEGSKSEDVAAE